MKKEADFIERISRELKNMRDYNHNFQTLLNQEDINLLHFKLTKKKSRKPKLSFKPSLSKHLPLPITTPISIPIPTLSTIANHQIISSRNEAPSSIQIKQDMTFRHKLEDAFPIKPMKTVSTFQITKTSMQRVLPSAIQRKKEENFKKLPLLIKRHNRHYDIDCNQLIIDPLLSERYDSSPFTERAKISRNGLLPTKVEEYSFHKSLKLRDTRLFIHNKTIINSQSTSKQKKPKSHKKTIEMQIVHYNSNGTIDLKL